MNWPTKTTLVYLAIGLLPLAYVIFRAFRMGAKEISSLRFCGVFLFWIGYHLSPWLAYLAGEPWESSLLVDRYIDASLLFSSLCMATFLAGHEIASGRGAEARATAPASQPTFPLEKTVTSLSVIALLLFVWGAGGMETAWRDPMPRGAGQFDVRDWDGKIRHLVGLAANLTYVVLAFLSSELIVKRLYREERRPQGLLAGSAGLVTASLHGLYGFSRLAGLPFFIFAFVALRQAGRRSWALVAASCLLALYLGTVGYYGRGLFHPGVGNFVDAVYLSQRFQAESLGDLATLGNLNMLSATEAWTKKAETSEYEPADVSVMAPRLLWNLHPFPSELVPIRPIGTDLSDIMGTWGSTGITTPAFAELYYVLGYSGCIAVLFLGMAYGWFDREATRQAGVISSMCVLLCVASLGVGLHGSLRAMTRYVLYAFLFLSFQRSVLQPLIKRWADRT
jgi:hypothetical protein